MSGRRTATAAVAALAVLVAGAGWGIGSPTAAAVGPVVVAMLERERRHRRVMADHHRRQELLPRLVDDLIQSVRSGRSLRSACEELVSTTGPGAPELQDVMAPMAAALRAHRTLAEAAAALGSARDPSVRLLAATLRVLAVNGGPALPALRRLRHTLMGVVHAERQAQVEAGQALASAALLTAAPSAFALVAATVDARLAFLYLFEPAGTACAGTAVGLSYGGWRWMQHIVESGSTGSGPIGADR